MKEDPQKKIGLYYRKYSIREDHIFRTKTGLPATRGFLQLKRVFTSIVIGTVREKDLETKLFDLTPYDLVKLKRLLANFDSRLLTWKDMSDLDKEVKL